MLKKPFSVFKRVKRHQQYKPSILSIDCWNDLLNAIIHYDGRYAPIPLLDAVDQYLSTPTNTYEYDDALVMLAMTAAMVLA